MASLAFGNEAALGVAAGCVLVALDPEPPPQEASASAASSAKPLSGPLKGIAREE
jgi:hypothetical protein